MRQRLPVAGGPLCSAFKEVKTASYCLKAGFPRMVNLTTHGRRGVHAACGLLRPSAEWQERKHNVTHVSPFVILRTEISDKT